MGNRKPLKRVAAMADWRQAKAIGTAYVDGALVWGARIHGLFYCDSKPSGTNQFHSYKRMEWCSPKQVYERRNG